MSKAGQSLRIEDLGDRFGHGTHTTDPVRGGRRDHRTAGSAACRTVHTRRSRCTPRDVCTATAWCAPRAGRATGRRDGHRSATLGR